MGGYRTFLHYYTLGPDIHDGGRDVGRLHASLIDRRDYRRGLDGNNHHPKQLSLYSALYLTASWVRYIDLGTSTKVKEKSNRGRVRGWFMCLMSHTNVIDKYNYTLPDVCVYCSWQYMTTDEDIGFAIHFDKTAKANNLTEMDTIFPYIRLECSLVPVSGTIVCEHAGRCK